MVKKTPPSSQENLRKPIKNTFTLYQVKKMIGKKLIMPWNNITISIQDKNSSKFIKSKVLETSTKKNIILTTMCVQGILYVIKNIDMYLAIHSISYKELEDFNCNDISVIVIQYSKMNKTEVLNLINY